jgi:hypothetical protein
MSVITNAKATSGFYPSLAEILDNRFIVTRGGVWSDCQRVTANQCAVQARPGKPSPATRRCRRAMTSRRAGEIMEIPKEQILQMLRDRGNHDQAQQADQQLPDQVDPDQHGDLLQQLGINPSELLGGLGDKLGL